MKIGLNIKKYGKAFVHYFLLYLLLISHNAVIYNVKAIPIRLFIVIVCIAFFLLLKRIRRVELFRLCTILCISILVTSYLGEFFWGGYSGQGIMYTLLFLEEVLIVYVVVYYDIKNVVERYVKIVVVFATISLGFYFWSLIDYEKVVSLFQEVEISSWIANYHGQLFYSIRGRDVERNVGIFMEPGLYQIILNTAIYFLIFMDKMIPITQIRKYLFLAILIFTVLTTKSATGYLGLFIIGIGIIFSNQVRISKVIKRIVLSAFLFGIFFLLGQYVAKGQDSILYTIVLKKVTEISSEEETTGSVRMATIITCSKLIIANPFGWGYGYVNRYVDIYANGAVGAAIFRTIAATGVLPVGYSIYHFFVRAYRSLNNKAGFFTFVALYINTALAQSRTLYPAITIIALASYSNYKNRIKMPEEFMESLK